MGANKAPEPDGCKAVFFQYHWDTLALSVTTTVLDFLNGGTMPATTAGECHIGTSMLVPVK